jgi:hypothetical protein
MTVRLLTLLRSTESHGLPPQALMDAGARAAQPRGLPGAGGLPSGSQPSENDEERPFDQGTLRSLMVWRVRRQGLEP